MKIKQVMTALFAAAMFSGLFAGENLIKNGDFEKITRRAKGADKYLFNQIRNGWDIGAGPMAVLPESWLLNGGKGKLRVITVGENGENKEKVHSGKHSLYFEEIDGHIANGCVLKPGKYELSFWYKGTGTIMFAMYEYGINPKTGKVGRHLGSYSVCRFMANSPGKWAQHKKIITVGQAKDAKHGSIALCGNKGGFYLDDIVIKAVK